MSRRRIVDLTQEAISYQVGSSFFEELTTCIGDIRRRGTPTTASVAESPLANIIMKHTGILVDVRIETSRNVRYNAVMMVPLLNTNSQFQVWLRSVYGELATSVLEKNRVTEESLKKLNSSTKGAVDLKTGRLSGIFSKLPGTLSVGTGLFDVLEDDEIAAIVLHECGHFFNYCWIVLSNVSQNVAIQAASTALANSETRKERIQLLSAFETGVGVKLQSATVLADEPASEEQYQAVLLQATLSQIPRSVTGSIMYDATGDEYLADQYAAMWGGGRAFATADEKLNRYYGINTRRTLFAHTMVEASKAISLLTIAVLGVTTLPPLLIVPCLVALGLSDGTAAISRYDTPVDRAVRVKRSLIQAIKDRTLPPSTQKQLVEDIAFIDTLLAGAKDRRTVFDMLWTSLTPARRRQYSQKKFQQELEGVINNQLFVSASKLSQLAGNQGA